MNIQVNHQVMGSPAIPATQLAGQAPAVTAAMLDLVMVQTLGIAMHNAVDRQQNASMISSAAVTAACAKMLSIPLNAAQPAPPALSAPGSPSASASEAIEEALANGAAAIESPRVAPTNGSGKACQSVAQSVAIAVQDAADHLRNVSTLAATAIGVAMAHYLATGDEKYVHIVDKAQELTKAVADNFTAVGAAAATVLREMDTSAG